MPMATRARAKNTSQRSTGRRTSGTISDAQVLARSGFEIPQRLIHPGGFLGFHHEAELGLSAGPAHHLTHTITPARVDFGHGGHKIRAGIHRLAVPGHQVDKPLGPGPESPSPAAV